MRSFKTAGILSIVAALLATVIALYAQNYVGEKALQQRVMDRTADWQKLITVYNHGLELQEQVTDVLTLEQIAGIEALTGNNVFSLEELKGMLAEQKLGSSGYFIARTSDGIYQVSKDRVRDGENIWNVQDADGNYVVREHTQTALEYPEGGTFSEYYWQNNDDPTPRKKVASYAYVSDLDWVVGATAYYDDKPTLPPNTAPLFVMSLIIFGILFFGLAFVTRRSTPRS